MKILIRIILSPIIFIIGCFMMIILSIFPLPMIVIMSFFGILLEPFVWIFRQSGAKIKGIEPFINDTGSNMLGHFLGLTVYFWGAFAYVYIYIKKGTIWLGD